MNPVCKLNFFLFNIEGYGEFFSGITPEVIIFYMCKRHCMNFDLPVFPMGEAI
jgi:hypothetical protein